MYSVAKTAARNAIIEREKKNDHWVCNLLKVRKGQDTPNKWSYCSELGDGQGKNIKGEKIQHYGPTVVKRVEMVLRVVLSTLHALIDWTPMPSEI